MKTGMYRLRLALGVCLVLVGLGAADVSARTPEGVQVEITAMDPAYKTTLQTEDKLYLKVNYESDIPLRFQALAMRDGCVLEVGAIKNRALLHAQGKGEALAWVMYLNETHVDAVRLKVFDEKWQEVLQLNRAADVTWNTAAQSKSRPLADWIGPLERSEKRLTDFFYDPSPRRFGALYDIFFYLNLAAIPVYVLLQLHMLCRYRYRWRELSMIPLFPYLIVGFYALADLGIESCLLITFVFRYTVAALLMLLILWLAKRFWQHKLPPPKLYKQAKTA